MSDSVFLESNQSFVDKICRLDNELQAEIANGKHKKDGEIYQSYLDRLSFYEKSSLVPLSECDKVLLQDKKENLYLELKLFKLKQEVIKQLEDTNAVLNDLKNS